jgi:chromodomain-helicase-DNA-binding protein 4
MILAVKSSSEPGHLKQETMKYLKGVKGTLVQKKKKEAERKATLGTGGSAVPGAASAPVMGQQQAVYTGNAPTPFHLFI